MADINTETAARIFNIPVEEVTPAMRARAKTINYVQNYSTPMTYCKHCGGRIYGDEQDHECDEAGLNAMKKNPFLSLLIDKDGKRNQDAPVILGGGIEE